MKNIFMTFEEVENCTFEPNCGTMDTCAKKNHEGEEIIPGQFFDKLGVNFATSNPKIYKMGILKKALLHWKNDRPDDSLNTMY